MRIIHFQTLDELQSYLTNSGLDTTKFFVTPDFVKSIVGIACDGKLVYSYEAMIEDLYEEYLDEPAIDDPYESAIEWIDFNTLNTKPSIAHIIFEPPIEGYDMLFEVKGLDDFMEPYYPYSLGMTDTNGIVFDDDLADADKEKIAIFFDSLPDVYPVFI